MHPHQWQANPWQPKEELPVISTFFEAHRISEVAIDPRLANATSSFNVRTLANPREDEGNGCWIWCAHRASRADQAH